MTTRKNVIQESSDRKVAEQADLAQFRLVETVFNHSVSGLVILDRDFNFVRVNAAYARACRRDIEDFAGRNHFVLYPSDAKAIFEEVVRTKRPYETFSRAFTFADQPERGVTYWDWTLVPILDRQGEVEYLAFSVNEVTERERAQQSMRESEDELRVIFEGTLDGIVVSDAETKKFLAANAAICGMLGYTYDEIVRICLTDIHPKRDLPRVIDQIERLRRGEIHMAPDIPILRKDGSMSYAHMKASPIRLGGKECLLSVFCDVTQRKQADQELSESEARFRGLVEQSIAGIYIIQDGKFIYVNPRLAEIFGYDSAEEMIDRDALSIVVEKERGTVAETVRQRLKGETAGITYDFTGLRKDGSTIDVGVHGTRTTRGGRRVIIGLLQDISEKKRAEEALRESEARFRKLTEMSSDFYWESDVEHRFTQGNEAANVNVAAVWHTPIGKRRWEIPYLSPDEANWQAHRAMLGAHVPFRNFELSRLGADGTEHFLSVSGDPLFDASGTFIGYRGVGTDITERKRVEVRLRAAEEQFRGLVEQSIAGIYIIQDGKFVYVNARLAEIFGYPSANDLIGRDASLLVSEKDRSIVAENVRRRLECEVANISYEFSGLRKDGSMIVVGVHGARATHGDHPAVIGLVQDISEKKRAGEEIQRYVKQLKTAFKSTVDVATTLSEMRDPYTTGHERRVADIAVAIGAELGLDPHQQEGLHVAGHLHDIGKMTIPAEILAKPGRLTAIEFQLIQGHAQASYDVLKKVEFPWPVAQVALQHHERMDGTGYPQGLKGEAIRLEARIMAVADVVEAMSSHRPYRAGLGIEKALAEIERGRGAAYDADAADACLRLFREKRYELPA